MSSRKALNVRPQMKHSTGLGDVITSAVFNICTLYKLQLSRFVNPTIHRSRELIFPLTLTTACISSEIRSDGGSLEGESFHLSVCNKGTMPRRELKESAPPEGGQGSWVSQQPPSGQDHHILGIRCSPREKFPISSSTVKTHPPDMCK